MLNTVWLLSDYPSFIFLSLQNLKLVFLADNCVLCTAAVERQPYNQYHMTLSLQDLRSALHPVPTWASTMMATELVCRFRYSFSSYTSKWTIAVVEVGKVTTTTAHHSCQQLRISRHLTYGMPPPPPLATSCNRTHFFASF